MTTHQPALLYGLVGRKLGHSFSRRFFTEKFSREGIDAGYRNFEIDDIGQLHDIVGDNPALRGLNVTIPYKTEVIPLLDSLDDNAAAVGAVNVISIKRTGDGRTILRGHNTDVIGFGDMLSPFDFEEDTRALVLGTGGASLAVIAALDKRHIGVTRVSRRSGDGVITYSDIDAHVIDRHRIIINATPLGTYPDTDSCPDIPYALLGARHVCIDLVYNPEVTRFMARGAARGAVVRNGLGMLISQALASYDIWTNQP